VLLILETEQLQRWQGHYEEIFQEDKVNTEENENNENPPHHEGSALP
jgi:hypothetical protein